MDDLLDRIGASMHQERADAVEALAAPAVRGEGGGHGKCVRFGHGIHALEPGHEGSCLSGFGGGLLQCGTRRDRGERHSVPAQFSVYGVT